MNNKLDLATLDTVAACDKGAEIELRHPVTTAPLGVFISIVGRDSSVFKEYIRNRVNDKLRRDALDKKRGRDEVVPTMEESEAESIELVTLCTTGWRNVTYKGTELAFNVANALMLYAEMPWIRRQVDEAIGDLENFMSA